jgi:hypothetical protein
MTRAYDAEVSGYWLPFTIRQAEHALRQAAGRKQGSGMPRPLHASADAPRRYHLAIRWREYPVLCRPASELATT